MIVLLIFLECLHHSSWVHISRELLVSVRRVMEPLGALSASGARPSRPAASIGRGDSSCNQGWREVQQTGVGGCAPIRARRRRRGGATITVHRAGRKQWWREAANKVERGRKRMNRRPRRWRSHGMSCQGEEEPSRKKDMHSYKESQVHEHQLLSATRRLLDNYSTRLLLQLEVLSSFAICASMLCMSRVHSVLWCDTMKPVMKLKRPPTNRHTGGVKRKQKDVLETTDAGKCDIHHGKSTHSS